MRFLYFSVDKVSKRDEEIVKEEFGEINNPVSKTASRVKNRLFTGLIFFPTQGIAEDQKIAEDSPHIKVTYELYGAVYFDTGGITKRLKHFVFSFPSHKQEAIVAQETGFPSRKEGHDYRLIRKGEEIGIYHTELKRSRANDQFLTLEGHNYRILIQEENKQRTLNVYEGEKKIGRISREIVQGFSLPPHYCNASEFDPGYAVPMFILTAIFNARRVFADYANKIAPPLIAIDLIR